MRPVLSTAIALIFIGPTALITSCSGSGLTGSAHARAILEARFDTPDKTDCSAAGHALSIGKFTDPTPVDDGMQGDGGIHHIACRVADIGNGRFAVDGTMNSDDHTLFAIRGTFPKATDAKGFKADSVTLDSFTQADGQCTVLYASSSQGVVAGRVWGEVTCAAATREPDAGDAGSGTCVTIAQFRFEDCMTK